MPQRINVLEVVRNHYISAFVSTIIDFDPGIIELEPFKIKYHQNSKDGNTLNFRERIDFSYIDEYGNNATGEVRVGKSYEFDTFTDRLGISDSMVTIGPFSWDMAKIEISGVEDDEFWNSFADWVHYRMQDSSGSEPLKGCLHSVRLLEQTSSGKTLLCDLGSLSVFGFDELIALCAVWGVPSIKIGTV